MILGVIVTYNPNLSELIENIGLILPQVDKLVIFDNASVNSNELFNIKYHDSVEWIMSKDNVGLGAAFNQVIEYYQNMFDFLITFDQDTRINKKLVSNLLKLFEITDVGIVGPTFESFHKGNLPYRDVHVLIQSASIFRMEIFNKIGGFNSRYFIDSVDFELCLRAKKNGYRVIMSNLDFINHNLGFKKRIMSLNFVSHSAFRNFYIARNHVDLSIRYFRYFPFFILKKNFFFGIHFFKLLFLERSIKSIILFFKGFFQGFNF